MQSKSPFAKRLREARTQRGISQKDLGILADIDPYSASARVNQYERDKHIPDFMTAKRLATVLEVPVLFFYADEDDLAELVLMYAKATKRKRAEIRRQLLEG